MAGAGTERRWWGSLATTGRRAGLSHHLCKQLEQKIKNNHFSSQTLIHTYSSKLPSSERAPHSMPNQKRAVPQPWKIGPYNMSPRTNRSRSPSSYARVSTTTTKSKTTTTTPKTPKTAVRTHLQPRPHIDIEKCCQSPRLLPAASIAYASRSVLTDPFAYADALLYGPDLGSMPLRTAIASWLADFYGGEDAKLEEISITGGGSPHPHPPHLQPTPPTPPHSTEEAERK